MRSRPSTLCRLTLASLCVATAWHVAEGQSIAGRVVTGIDCDSAVSLAIVTLETRDRQILAFAQTEDDGTFALEWPPGHDSLLLVGSALGYRSDTVGPIADWPPATARSLCLRAAPEVLSEVVVRARRQLVGERGDTTVYDVEGLSRSRERTSAELLRQLPGFEVDEGGGLRYRGEAVDRLLVGGDDFMNRRRAALLGTLKGADLDEVHVYRGEDPYAPRPGGELTVDLKLTPAAASRPHVDLTAGAGLDARRDLVAGGYRLGRDKLLLKGVSSNARLAELSVADYILARNRLDADGAPPRIPRVYLPQPGYAAVDQHHLEAHASAERHGWQLGFGAELGYANNASREHSRIATDVFETFTEATAAARTSDLTANLSARGALSPRTSLRYGLDFSRFDESLTTERSTGLDPCCLDAQVAATQQLPETRFAHVVELLSRRDVRTSRLALRNTSERSTDLLSLDASAPLLGLPGGPTTAYRRALRLRGRSLGARYEESFPLSGGVLAKAYLDVGHEARQFNLEQDTARKYETWRGRLGAEARWRLRAGALAVGVSLDRQRNTAFAKTDQVVLGARVAVETRTASGVDLDVSLERTNTPYRSDYPPELATVVDELTTRGAYATLRPIASQYQLSARSTQLGGGGRSIRLWHLIARFGDEYTWLRATDAGGARLLEVPARVPHALHIDGVHLRQWHLVGGHRRVKLGVSAHSFTLGGGDGASTLIQYAALGELARGWTSRDTVALGTPRAEFDLRARATVRYSDVGGAIATSEVRAAASWRFWRHWRTRLSVSLPTQLVRNRIWWTPGLGCELAYGLGPGERYSVGLNGGQLLRRRGATLQTPPVVTGNAVTSVQTAVLPGYVLLVGSVSF